MTSTNEYKLGFWQFVVERQAIWHRRFRLGLPQSEWTNDLQLQQRHFTNLFRDLDRGTRVLFTSIDRHRSSASPAWRNFNMAFYRAVNRDTTWLETCDGWLKDFDHARACAQTIASRGLSMFTFAWERNQTLPRQLVKGVEVWNGAITHAICQQATSLDDILYALRGWPILGKSGGIAGLQHALDLTYQYSNLAGLRNQPMLIRMSGHGGGTVKKGPGAAAFRYHGINVPNVRFLDSAVQFVLRDLVKRIQDDQDELLLRHYEHVWNVIAPTPERRLEFIDVEHALCEYDKYTRNVSGMRRFRPRNELIP